MSAFAEKQRKAAGRPGPAASPERAREPDSAPGELSLVLAFHGAGSLAGPAGAGDDPAEEHPPLDPRTLLAIFLNRRTSFVRFTGIEFLREKNAPGAVESSATANHNAIQWAYTFVTRRDGNELYVRAHQSGTEIVNYFQGVIPPPVTQKAQEKEAREGGRAAAPAPRQDTPPPESVSPGESAREPRPAAPAGAEPPVPVFRGRRIPPGGRITVDYNLVFDTSSDVFADETTAAETLRSLARFLKQNPTLSVVVTGNLYNPDMIQGNSAAALNQFAWLNKQGSTAQGVMRARANRVWSILSGRFGAANRIRAVAGSVLSVDRKIVITIINPTQ